MNTSSYFIENKGLFGSYPTQDDIKYFESIGVRHFIDLTTPEDTLKPYETEYNIIKFPIPDRKIPQNIRDFSSFILKLMVLIKNLNDEKVYIHCKGGHGRSGIVVACILKKYHNITPTEALELTNVYHSKRKEMKEKWRNIGSPQTNSQKKFVHKLFNPLIFTKVSNGFKSGLSNLSNHIINIDGETYENAEIAYQTIKLKKLNLETIDLQCKNIYYYKYYFERKYNMSEEDKLELMKSIIETKYKQNICIKENLLNIGLRSIIYNSHKDPFWGIDKNGVGQNHLGKILTDIKHDLLIAL